MSDVADMEYLGDGLAEEILNLLAKLGELNVAARTSSFYFKNKEVDIQTIGEHLGVAHVLEGSVRFQGDRVRVTAQLIKAEDGFHLWSETYDRESKDLLALQDDIARQVVNSLHVLLSPDSRAALSRATTVDPLAYDYYLRGRAYLRLPRSASNLRFAVELFQKAVALHAGFADAYAGLCDGFLGLYSVDRDVANFEAAESACHRALTLDRRAASVYIALGNLYRSSGQYQQAIDEFNTALSLNRSLPDAHLGLGDTYMDRSDPESAEQHYRRAIELQPNYWQALLSMGNFLFEVGRTGEAIPYYTRISELMPDSETVFNNLGAAFFVTGKFEQASHAWQRSLELAPSKTAYSNVASSEFFLGHYDRALALYHKAVELAPEDYELWGNLADAYRHSDYGVDMAEPMYRNAIRLAENRLRINPSDADTLALVGHYYASIGERERAEQYIADAAAVAQGNMYVDYNAATAWTALGEPEQALAALKRALAAGYPWHIAAADANLAELSDTPQFLALAPERP
jgi:TolB-like protein/Tfp pilus assembly protein PilF